MQLAGAAIAAWMAGWGGYALWLVFSYRANLSVRCPVGADYEVFCRAESADELLAGLLHAGGYFLLGAIILGGVWLLVGSLGRPGSGEPA